MRYCLALRGSWYGLESDTGRPLSPSHRPKSPSLPSRKHVYAAAAAPPFQNTEPSPSHAPPAAPRARFPHAPRHGAQQGTPPLPLASKYQPRAISAGRLGTDAVALDWIPSSLPRPPRKEEARLLPAIPVSERCKGIRGGKPRFLSLMSRYSRSILQAQAVHCS